MVSEAMTHSNPFLIATILLVICGLLAYAAYTLGRADERAATRRTR